MFFPVFCRYCGEQVVATDEGSSPVEPVAVRRCRACDRVAVGIRELIADGGHIHVDSKRILSWLRRPSW